MPSYIRCLTHKSSCLTGSATTVQVHAFTHIHSITNAKETAKLRLSAAAISTMQMKLQMAVYSYVKPLGMSWLFHISITVTSHWTTVSPPHILRETKFVTNNKDINKELENIKPQTLDMYLFQKDKLVLWEQFSFPKNIWLLNPNTFILLCIYTHLLLHTHTFTSVYKIEKYY